MAVEAGGIGARLRAGREKLGLTVLQVAERIHTDPKIVEAIEAENFEALGAPVYARGHIRHYADLVGESANELTQTYSNLSKVGQPDLTRIVKAPAGPESNKLVAPALVVIVVFAVVGAIWWIAALSKKTPQMSETHVVTNEAPASADASAAPDEASAAGDSAGAPAVGGAPTAAEPPHSASNGSNGGAGAGLGQGLSSAGGSASMGATSSGATAAQAGGGANGAGASSGSGSASAHAAGGAGAATADADSGIAARGGAAGAGASATGGGVAAHGGAGGAGTSATGGSVAARGGAGGAGTSAAPLGAVPRAPSGAQPTRTSSATPSGASTATSSTPTRVASALPARPSATGATVASTPAAEPASAPRAKAQSSVTLRYSADSWTEVYDASGARLFYDVGAANTVQTVVGTPPLRVVLGNASGVSVEYNGHSKPIAKMSRPDGSVQFSITRSGEVVRAKPVADGG